MIAEQQEVLRSMEGFVEKNLSLLRPVKDSWQPSDLLPAMHEPDWHDRVEALRRNAAGLSDEALVVLVGNIVTEEALPSYQSWLNRVEGLGDKTGASQTPWALWTRGWTAEENRHGDLLSRYLLLSGRVNMRSVDVTVQHLLKNGFDLNSDNDAYKSLVYAAFQERATKISHTNTGRLAEKCGDPVLSKMCLVIAGDEARHEDAYKKFFGWVLEHDTSRAVIAYAEMMGRRIAMPARLMSDGTERDIFENFAVVAQRSQIYTTRDYADVLSHLNAFWKIADLKGLSPEAQQAQETVCGLPDRFMKKADKVARIVSNIPKEPFSWIFERAA